MVWCDRVHGQELAIGLLQSALEQDRLAQSYLFFGPEGVGKKLTALALAMAVQCQEGFGIGCGVCDSCQKLLRGSHGDWHFIEPSGNFIRIDQIRELQSVMWLRPFTGRRRIAVLDPAERMNEPAANALLKLLEEPPGDSLVILISTTPTQLLPTIRSRCHPVRFTTLSHHELSKVLPLGLPEEQQALLLRNAQGSQGRLWKLLQDEEWEEQRRQGITWYIQEPTWDTWQRIHFAAEQENNWKERESWRQLWALWQSLTRDRLMLVRGAAVATLWNPDTAPSLLNMPLLGSAALEQRLAQLHEALIQLQTNTSPRLIAETLLLGWQ